MTSFGTSQGWGDFLESRKAQIPDEAGAIIALANAAHRIADAMEYGSDLRQRVEKALQEEKQSQADWKNAMQEGAQPSFPAPATCNNCGDQIAVERARDEWVRGSAVGHYDEWLCAACFNEIGPSKSVSPKPEVEKIWQGDFEGLEYTVEVVRTPRGSVMQGPMPAASWEAVFVYLCNFFFPGRVPVFLHTGELDGLAALIDQHGDDTVRSLGKHLRDPRFRDRRGGYMFDSDCRLFPNRAAEIGEARSGQPEDRTAGASRG